jgi:AcrR family transcriptional regulator
MTKTVKRTAKRAGHASANRPLSKPSLQRDGESLSTNRTADARAGARARRSLERRDAILAAALEEFSARGFAATRLDDVARRANVAKGTIYLHFADKETLFQELIRTELSPVVAALEQASNADIPLRQVTDRLVEVFAREIFGTRRKDVIRLVLTEGPRFPALAEFYYREVISRAMGAMRTILRRAFERGELKTDALIRFPQLLPAPGIVAIVWGGLFDRFDPLDVRAMMRAHFDVLLGPGGAA